MYDVESSTLVAFAELQVVELGCKVRYQVNGDRGPGVTLPATVGGLRPDSNWNGLQ
jgi:hypothetical protein